MTATAARLDAHVLDGAITCTDAGVWFAHAHPHRDGPDAAEHDHRHDHRRRSHRGDYDHHPIDRSEVR